MSFGEMCSFFYQAMETSAVEGDLSDVVLRAGGGGEPVTKDFQDLSAKASPLSPEAIKTAPASAAAPLVSVPHASGVKRRKGQAKRVICIPAPAPGDQESSSSSSIKSSSGSVVVPSDLWAWRKYGQKPIKGSPYPRGYYRCSSSKGCSARKQVERSRSDPNMLVITYTSDHNHPWPTHRNSLAGSTRSSQPSKTTHNTPKSPSNSKQEQEDIFLMTSSTTSPLEVIKEENLDLDRIFDQSYKDMGFFDELGGLEPDPMSFFFSSSRENKGLDPLSFFDWDGN